MAAEGDRKLGLFAATMIMISALVGAAIFSMASTLGRFGPVALIGLALAGLGALNVAGTFGRLARRDPGSAGPAGYAKAAFGDKAAFTTSWYFWLAAWGGNTAILFAWTGFIEAFVDQPTLSLPVLIVIGIGGLWLPVVINLVGPRFAAKVQVTATVIVLVVLIALCVIGPFFISLDDLGQFNATGDSVPLAIIDAFILAVFSFLGVESVAVLSGRIKDPHRNVMRASIIGVLVALVLYLVSILVVFGTVPDEQLHSGLGSFALAYQAIFGSPLAGKVVALAAVVAGFAALLAWTLLASEMPLIAAKMGLFPARFATVNAKGTPTFGLIVSAIMATVLMVVAWWVSPEGHVFDTTSVMVGVAGAATFLFCGAAEVKWSIGDRSQARSWLPGMINGLVTIVFALVVVAGCVVGPHGNNASLIFAAIWGLIGVVFYLKFARRNAEPSVDERLSPVSE